MTTTAAIAPAAPKPRRRRWPYVVLSILALAILIPLGLYLYSAAVSRAAWADAVAEAERDLPRWRLLEMEEDRPKIPDAENSALHMIAIARKAPRVDVIGAPRYNEIFPPNFPPNVEFNVQQTELIRGRLALIPEALAEARKLKGMPRGRYPMIYNDDFFSSLLTEQQNNRLFAEWLWHDAMLLAQDRRPDEAVESCQAILNAGRALDGELTLIGTLIRFSLQAIHVTTLERVLAQGTPSEESLQRLQALLDREIKESSLLPAMRGERAGDNHLMENVRNGKVSAATLRGFFGGARLVRPGDFINAGLREVFPSSVLKFYPAFLQHMNRNVEAMKVPIHERAARFKELEHEAQTTGNLLIRSLSPAMFKVNQSEARTQAFMRTALVGVACERYRLAHKEQLWPDTLDALVAAKLLDAVPTDPFDGQPLRYRRTKEGVVIYSIGMDLKDDGGNINRERWNDPGVDLGFRLWNVDQRRRPPRPPVLIVDEK